MEAIRGGGSVAVAAEQRSRIRRALEGLHPDQRHAVELSFLDGFSHSEIARKLGEPLGTVKTRIRTGLTHLRDSLRAQFCGGERA